MPKMGGDDLARDYEKTLANEIDKLFENYKMSNLNKSTVEVSLRFIHALYSPARVRTGVLYRFKRPRPDAVVFMSKCLCK